MHLPNRLLLGSKCQQSVTAQSSHVCSITRRGCCCQSICQTQTRRTFSLRDSVLWHCLLLAYGPSRIPGNYALSINQTQARMVQSGIRYFYLTKPQRRWATVSRHDNRIHVLIPRAWHRSFNEQIDHSPTQKSTDAHHLGNILSSTCARLGGSPFILVSISRGRWTRRI